MSSDDVEIVTVVVGCLEPLLARGILDALRTDRRLRVSVSGLTGSAFEDEVFRQMPRLVIVGEKVAYSQLVRVRSADRPPEILVVARDGAELVGPLLLATGVSCLASGANSGELLAAVRCAVDGRPTFSHTSEGEGPERRYPKDVAHLTEREVEVLGRLSNGYTNPEIAEALHISVATVRTHVARIFQKLDVHSRRDVLLRSDNPPR